MISQASGLALRGYLPIVHSFACFLAARPNEQIYNQCSESTKAIYVGSLAGLLPGGPGHSHQCVRDISALGAVPHHLPGTNAFLREFSDRFGVPYDATRGGAETMYPEYMQKVAAMPKPVKK